MNMGSYWESIDIVLQRFPNLRKQIPLNWPRCISYEQVREYDRHRTDKYWEHQNLSSLAYTLKNSNEERTCALYESVLTALEWFSTEMTNLAKASVTLSPLWENSWNVNDNPFWSVISEVKLTQLLHTNKWTILGFHQKIGTSSQNADILASRNGKVTHIDVEASSMTRIVEGDDNAFRRFIVKRTKDKIDKKLKYVPQAEFGMVGMVFRPRTADIQRFAFKSSTTDRVKTGHNNVWGNIYWLAAGHRPEEKFGLHLADNTLMATLP